jgi:hypothetical protein
MIRDKVFISYSHKDEKWLNDLVTMMQPFIDANLVEPWSDKLIQPGQQWRDEIETALASTKVAVLLVSKDFLASRFIQDNELPPLLEAAQQGMATVLCILIGDCCFEDTEVGTYQFALDIKKPLGTLRRPERDKALKKAAHAIKNACNKTTLSEELADDPCGPALSSATAPLIMNAPAEVERYKPRQWEKLQVLLARFPNLDASSLQIAVRQALQAFFRESLIRAPHDALLSAEAPIRDGQDLLARVKQHNIFLDDALLAELEQALRRPSFSDNDPSAISSLLVMMLPPRNPSLDPSSTKDCPAYFFRAFFCQDERSEPDQWLRIDEKSVEPSIRHVSWEFDLEKLIIAALRKAKMQPKLETGKLLIEIFLPLHLLHTPIGSRVKLPLPGGESKELCRDYPIVLRSSDRFQELHEAANEWTFNNPLPAKWAKFLSRQQSFWWHDASELTHPPTIKAKEDLSKLFDAFAVRPEWFAMKRLGPLPEVSDSWLMGMLWSCPAVAIWWPPTASSTPEQRRQCFEICYAESEIRPFGSAPPSEELKPHATDHFHHPAADNSLRLFFDLATTVLRGQFEHECGQSFEEMVLLVDCPDRWPVPLDYAPGHWSRSADGGDVVDAREDDILISPG